MMWFDLMVDIETAGLPPNGALMSLGAVFFDLETCTLGPTFSKAVNLATSVRDGGKIDPATMMWWLGQSEQARRNVMFDTYDVRRVLADFSAFITEHSRVQDVRPWGNSSGFDLTIIGGHYDRAGIAKPWRFGRERCFRTVRNMYPQVEYNVDDKGDGAHTALDDAIFQAQHLFKIKNRNKKVAV
jgi:hypothetical protein